MTPLYLLYLATFSSVVIIYLFTKLWNHILITRKVQKALNKFPSRKAHWLFGHLLEVCNDSFLNIDSSKEKSNKKYSLDA